MVSSYIKCNLHTEYGCPVFCQAVMDQYPPEVPDVFLCPISLEVMNPPVIDEYGFSYDQKSLRQNLLRGNINCPMTGNFN
jgi:hypothetical protein